MDGIGRTLLAVGLGLGAPQISTPEEAFTAARARMVRDQLVPRGIHHPGVLDALGRVPRHAFVPEAIRSLAYEDTPLPIGFGQTLSQPFVVAFMTQALEPQPTDRVLEIGTGSGYHAAVISTLVRHVYTIERLEPLARRAEGDLQRLGFRNIHVRCGDGYLGWPEEAPFDAILVTCAPTEVPRALTDQLREGGRMVIPVGGPEAQDLVLLRKVGGELQRKAILPVRFVPMVPGA